MAKNNRNLPINYTNREFESIRADLMEIAERFYPDTFQDFSEASFGSLMLDAVAYVGDQLNFYLDYSVNESFLDTAYGLDNIIRQGRILGYKLEGRPSAYGEVAIYAEIPADPGSLGPSPDYLPLVKRGTMLSSEGGVAYVLTENVDFSDPKNPIVVSKVNNITGEPTHYAIKAYGNVVSGRFGKAEYIAGDYVKFKSINLDIPNLAEIISVVDSDGNEYFEVEYLSQDIIYQEIANNNYKNDNVPSILRPRLVNRKFTVVRTSNNVRLQFGSGEESNTDIIAKPQKVAVDIFGKDYVTDMTFDPTRITKGRNYGIVPANTTLTVVYRTVSGINNNSAVNTITSVTSPITEFKNEELLSNSQVAAVVSSLECTNEKPILGNVTYPSSAEVKQRVYDTFPTQNRAVTQTDYENLVYRMPAKYGSIKRCSVQKDADSLKRNLNMYVISEDSFGKLTKTNSTIKNNLKTWLNHYRMMNDTIDILDPYIINLGIEFVIVAVNDSQKGAAIEQSMTVLARSLKNGFYIGERFDISSIYAILKRVPAVLDVVKVRVINKTGAQYSNTVFDINSNTSPDGTQVICPKNAVFEFKYPQTDIKGKVR